jgi:hypothetical protein
MTIFSPNWERVRRLSVFFSTYDPKHKIALIMRDREQTVTNLREIFEVQVQAEYFLVQGITGGRFRVP